MSPRRKNDRGPQGTGKPDPSKDRAAHEVARGKKLFSSLRDLSNIQILAEEHVHEATEELVNQSDRGAALIAAALLDISLRNAMRCRLVEFKNCSDTLFVKDGAPLGTFSARITVARAIGVIGAKAESHLHCLRRIRNQFAHSPIKIDFTHGLIAGEIDKLAPDNPEWRPDWTPQRRRYVGTSILLGNALDAVIQVHHTDKVTVWTG